MPEIATENTGFPRFFIEIFRKERLFLVILAVGFSLAAFIYDSPAIAMWFGFAAAGYSAIANDSIQTIGTFIASNKRRPWWQLWLFMGGIFIITVTWGWLANAGDVSYGRLRSKGFENAPETFSYLQITAPLFLLVLTRMRMPVSTTFLLLSSFAASGKSIWAVTTKSVSGYLLAFVLAILLWLWLGKKLHNWFKDTPVHPVWVIAQWAASGLLWSFWLQQDLANIAVYLPRSLDALQFVAFTIAIVLGLGILFRQGGDRIQAIVDEKSGVVDVRAATVIDALYALILLVFKYWSNIPMSTTWVFVGLLAGREIALAHHRVANNDRAGAFRMMSKDLRSVILGFIFSMLLAAAINPAVRESLMGG